MTLIFTMILQIILITTNNKDMILTKEHQEQMLHSYLKTHTVTETEAYIQGMNDIADLINKQLNN